MIAIIGAKSSIAKSLLELLPKKETYLEYNSNNINTLSLTADRYLLCNGRLFGKSSKDITNQEIETTLHDNYIATVKICDKILYENRKARICVIGSESGYKGSYDTFYAGSKAALHHYIENKTLLKDQQLIGVSPGIISDSKMTLDRKDKDVLRIKLMKHPKLRFLTSMEVAQLCYFLLYTDQGYITNTVIRMHGGLK